MLKHIVTAVPVTSTGFSYLLLYRQGREKIEFLQASSREKNAKTGGVRPGYKHSVSGLMF
jgi:hypothetical protein